MIANDYKGMTVGKLFDLAVAKRADAEFITHKDARLTYGDVDRMANGLAASLAELGIKAGDNVALDMPNWPEWVVALVALGRLGAPVIPFNVRYPAQELDYMLRDADACAIIGCSDFGDKDFKSMFVDLMNGNDKIEHLIVVGDSSGDNVLDFDELASNTHQPPQTNVGPDDLLSISYTSGTTGNPKGAMLTHEGLIYGAFVCCESLELDESDVILGQMPNCHVFGIMATILGAAVCGGKIAFLDTYTPAAAIELIEQEKVTVHHGVPTMFIMELGHLNKTQCDVSSLKSGIMAGAPCPPEVAKRVVDGLIPNVGIFYGLTEAVPCTYSLPSSGDPTWAEHTGKPFRDLAVHVVDDDGNDLPQGEVGEVAVTGPCVMKGYYKNPDATAATLLADSFTRTGDLGKLDENGNLHIVGRKKELIIRAGYNIYPREVEDCLHEHPAVASAAVVGVQDDFFGEKSCACLILNEGQSVTKEEIQAFCTERLADYKVPDMVRVMDAFPLNPTGKVQKRAIAEQIARDLEEEAR
ncbi:class I adenylate-forming enzyme family protein [Candidatus Hydrogenedentota bacterium]